MSSMPALCTGCDRPLRDARTPAAKRPGAVAYAGKGVCVTCRKKALRTPHTTCVTCQQPMRPLRATEDEHPGTVPHAGHGLCRTCYDAERHGRAAIDAITPEQHAHTMAGYTAWLKERRDRGVPEDGWGECHDDGAPCLVELAARPTKTASQRRYLAAQLEALEAERLVPA